jgi:hypothetical protein
MKKEKEITEALNTAIDSLERVSYSNKSNLSNEDRKILSSATDKLKNINISRIKHKSDLKELVTEISILIIKILRGGLF